MKISRRRAFLKYVLAMVLICFSVFSCAKSDTSAQASENKEIRAVTENAYPPLNFSGSDGKGIGFEYDLTNKIADRLGRKVQWNLANWDVMIQSVRQDMYDVAMDGIAMTPERKEQVDFSIPYLMIKQIMLVRSDENRFKTTAEFLALSHARIAVQTGTTNFYVAVNLLKTTPENPGERITLFEHFGSAIQALISGDVDMVILDDISARGYMRSTGGRVKALDEVLSQEEIAYIFPKGSPLVQQFNQSIQAFTQDGTIDALAEKWFVQFEEQNSK